MRREFRAAKRQADTALLQVPDEALFQALDGESNSLAVLMKHVAGNLRSRWRDFLTTDGEKPDRQRDHEFVIAPEDTRQRLEQAWQDGWQQVFDTLDALTAEDLARTVRIRCEPHTVPRAMLRSLTHTSAHVGQIVMLAKHAQGRDWKTLSIPRGESEAFNRAAREKFDVAPATDA